MLRSLYLLLAVLSDVSFQLLLDVWICCLRTGDLGVRLYVWVFWCCLVCCVLNVVALIIAFFVGCLLMCLFSWVVLLGMLGGHWF